MRTGKAKVAVGRRLQCRCKLLALRGPAEAAIVMFVFCMIGPQRRCQTLQCASDGQPQLHLAYLAVAASGVAWPPRNLRCTA